MVFATDRRTRDLQGFAHERVTPTFTATGLTSSVHTPTGEATAERAEIEVEGDDVRYWIGKSSAGAELDPTETDGFLLHDGEQLVLDHYNKIRHFRVRKVGNGPSYLQVLYYR